MTATALLLINSCAVLESLLVKSEWRVEQASSLAMAERKLQEKDYPLVLVAIEPDQHEALSALITQHASSLWIGLIQRDALASEEMRNLLAACFHDFHTFPLERIRLSHSLGHALGMARLIRRYRPKIAEQPRFIQGESVPIRHLREQIQRLQHCRLPVLVTGPSGTGKELVARELHYSAFGEDSPFVAVNCGAMPHQLIQSELFGHVKGAFTGAQSRKIGRIEAADGGTLFLDEIGELPLEDQATLLRFLQEESIEAVGSHVSRSVDVRVIAATNIDVEQAVANGSFRMDLYYRLNVVRLRTPALRERAEDIQLLADEVLAEARGNRMISFTRKARQAMQSYDWPGNVRELRNRVQRAAVMCSGPFIDAQDMELIHRDSQLLNMNNSLKAVREAAERQALQRTLTRFPDQLEEVARQLDISRATLYRLLDKHDLL
ncbi:MULTISPECIES: sigma-54-dependent transcriptional regulator [Aeromonas]|uniref:Fis family transcriptional regulator n=2 Tax=Aeromonas TaxID=642 RepID=A0A175VJV1_AEREN|nr:sigma-54 dependent transcriptional regulator [Aeromonas enteropelogenes]KXU80749.1 Fis family transcriptional regulator [Aeromonas enteropelogenes]MCZ0753537.1 sigma-54 dependent transcriptional regulator [Aeromonas enteropelogenes]BEE18546.1 sigma-54-dependent Fis family transcriptional regulator [Aeromonas enteropelogenes]BEE22708.1 sigma-54-dependent Fis family transcriptional regulator [Aeromonas enteropelogenes]